MIKKCDALVLRQLQSHLEKINYAQDKWSVEKAAPEIVRKINRLGIKKPKDADPKIIHRVLSFCPVLQEMSKSKKLNLYRVWITRLTIYSMLKHYKCTMLPGQNDNVTLRLICALEETSQSLTPFSLFPYSLTIEIFNIHEYELYQEAYKTKPDYDEWLKLEQNKVTLISKEVSIVWFISLLWNRETSRQIFYKLLKDDGLSQEIVVLLGKDYLLNKLSGKPEFYFLGDSEKLESIPTRNDFVRIEIIDLHVAEEEQQLAPGGLYPHPGVFRKYKLYSCMEKLKKFSCMSDDEYCNQFKQNKLLSWFMPKSRSQVLSGLISEVEDIHGSLLADIC